MISDDSDKARVLMVGRDRRFLMQATAALARRGYYTVATDRPSQIEELVRGRRLSVVVDDPAGVPAGERVGDDVARAQERERVVDRERGPADVGHHRQPRHAAGPQRAPQPFQAVFARQGAGQPDLEPDDPVRARDGDPRRDESKDLYQPRPPGTRKVSVRFRDGEELVGHTRQLDRHRAGLFFTPLDPDSNNLRVFAVFGALWGVRRLL